MITKQEQEYLNLMGKYGKKLIKMVKAEEEKRQAKKARIRAELKAQMRRQRINTWEQYLVAAIKNSAGNRYWNRYWSNYSKPQKSLQRGINITRKHRSRLYDAVSKFVRWNSMIIRASDIEILQPDEIIEFKNVKMERYYEREY